MVGEMVANPSFAIVAFPTFLIAILFVFYVSANRVGYSGDKKLN